MANNRTKQHDRKRQSASAIEKQQADPVPGNNGSTANIIKAKVDICGKRPLLQRMFGPEALPLQKAEKSGVAGNDPEEWRRTKLVDPSGQLYVPATYIFGMIRDAAQHTRAGRGSLQPRVAATLQIEGAKIMLDRFLPTGGDPTTDQTQLVYIHVSGVRNPATKARNVRYRLAASPGWRASFVMSWDRTVVSRDQMRAILNDAGTLVGLADGRTSGYGRFSVVSFEFLEGGDANSQGAG